jgi:hypothetical protein
MLEPLEFKLKSSIKVWGLKVSNLVMYGYLTLCLSKALHGIGTALQSSSGFRVLGSRFGRTNICILEQCISEFL